MEPSFSLERVVSAARFVVGANICNGSLTAVRGRGPRLALIGERINDLASDAGWPLLRG
jgi:hypothetical protein